MSRGTVLVIDDDVAVRSQIRSLLENHGYGVIESESITQALDDLSATTPDAVILDCGPRGRKALETIARMKRHDAAPPLIALWVPGATDVSGRAIEAGAEHFLTKPVDPTALLILVERVLAHPRRRRPTASRQAPGEAVDPFLGDTAAIRRLSEVAHRATATDSPILIQGETGSGKGVLARWLHQNGPRAGRPFVDLNCAALSREFLEAELFGHEKGAFTGAVAAKPGLLEVADGGTVFLDEIGDIDPQVQPKLLKVLEEKRFRRLGEVRDRTVDVRLIAATHRDLNCRAREGIFRSDLYFRISTIPLHVPALRDRAPDIPFLARRMLQRIAADLDRPGIAIDPDAERALCAYPWPGNIRELRNVLEHAVLLSDRDLLERADLSFCTPVEGASPPSDLTLTLLEVERRYIAQVLQNERGRVEQAARRLGVPRSSLYHKIKALRIALPKA